MTTGAAGTVELLAEPLLFLALAAPMAALLDQLGLFAALAERLVAVDPARVAARCFVLAAATVALVNLDAAVVLLTPLAVRVARRTGRPPLPLAAVPAVLALVASSALPVSNLTNLVLLADGHAGAGALLAHLGLPTLVAVGVAWWRLAPDLAPPAGAVVPAAPGPGAPVDPGVLRRGLGVLVPTVVAFVALPALGWPLWPAALVADGVLVAMVRRVPWRSVPVAMVLAVPLVAEGLRRLLDGVEAPAAPAVVVALVAALAANLVNNLPALLGGLALVSGSARWALLLGVNAGAGVLLSGSLSSLLWRRILREQGVEVGWRWFARLGLRVTLPAFAAALAVLALQGVVIG